ncbi:MAG: hypothetical protein R3A80_01150 [Bdellovibrionota bacterium]
MRNLNSIQIFAWMVFFLTTVYGHVAMKLAAMESTKLTKVLMSPWTISAIIAWVFSSLLWLVILTKQPLLESNAISSIRYILISLSAVIFLSETLSAQQVLGAGLILIGVYLTI